MLKKKSQNKDNGYFFKSVRHLYLYDILILGIILMANAVFLYHNAFRCFNMFDMGGFLDASWRVFRGQKPYVDFIYYAGPVYLYINALFFKIFGFGKTAIWADVVTVHSLVITFIYVVLRRKTNFLISLLATILTVPSFYWAVSHPWHDQTAHLFGIAGLILWLWHAPSQEKKKMLTVSFLSGLLVVMAFMTKSNVGLAYATMFFMVALFSRRGLKNLGGYMAGLMVGALLAVLMIRYPKEFLEQTAFLCQGEGSKRLSKFLNPQNWFVNYYWIPLGLILPLSLECIKQARTQLILFLGISFVAVFAVVTGGMIWEANNFLWGVQMATAFILLFGIKDVLIKPWQKTAFRIAFIGLCLTSIFLTFLAVRNGVDLKVWSYRKNHLGTYPLKSQPLAGWLFNPLRGQFLDELVRFTKETIPEQDSLLNLSDMYILNALAGRDSYPNIPFQFMEHVIPADGKQTELVRNNIVTNPPDWVIIDLNSFKDELRFLGLGDFIQQRYQPAVRIGVYVVLKKVGGE